MSKECTWCQKQAVYSQDYPDGLSSFFGQLIRTTHVGTVYACVDDKKFLISPAQAKVEIKAINQSHEVCG